MGTAVETEITDYQAPLAQAELTAAGSKSKVRTVMECRRKLHLL